jgi:hypothetical protein
MEPLDVRTRRASTSATRARSPGPRTTPADIDTVRTKPSPKQRGSRNAWSACGPHTSSTSCSPRPMRSHYSHSGTGGDLQLPVLGSGALDARARSTTSSASVPSSGDDRPSHLDSQSAVSSTDSLMLTSAASASWNPLRRAHMPAPAESRKPREHACSAPRSPGSASGCHSDEGSKPALDEVDVEFLDYLVMKAIESIIPRRGRSPRCR